MNNMSIGRILNIITIVFLIMGSMCKTSDLEDVRTFCYFIAVIIALVKIKLYGVGW